MRNFVTFSAVCCLITAITTIAIHNFPYEELSFYQRTLLYKSLNYKIQKSIIIAHCLLVLFAMLGFYMVQKTKSYALTLLGFLFFTVFAMTEIIRQVLCLFYLNGLRESYVKTNSSTEQQVLEVAIGNFNHLNYSLYTIFIIAFGLACLCYGLSLIRSNHLVIDKWIGWLLTLWSIASFMAFANVFIKNSGMGLFVEILNNYFQPIIRILLAIWLWKKASYVEHNPKTIVL